jgi:hypothetical protein
MRFFAMEVCGGVVFVLRLQLMPRRAARCERVDGTKDLCAPTLGTRNVSYFRWFRVGVRPETRW